MMLAGSLCSEDQDQPVLCCDLGPCFSTASKPDFSSSLGESANYAICFNKLFFCSN